MPIFLVLPWGKGRAIETVTTSSYAKALRHLNLNQIWGRNHPQNDLPTGNFEIKGVFAML